ncbi:hypothetical protein [Dialister invisus]|uniref:hypothetical protein n=1 Tax=Dialister invisus TaxID=218538 RepID=UPI003520BEB5
MMQIAGEAVVIYQDKKRKHYSGEFEIEPNKKMLLLNAEGEISVEHLKYIPKLSFVGAISGESIFTKRFKSNGCINLHKLLASQIKIVFSGKSECEKIIAKTAQIIPDKNESIQIKGSFKRLVKDIFGESIDLNSSNKKEFKVRYLEGDVLEIEDCQVDEIHCRSIVIKGNSIINYLEYEVISELGPDSSVLSKKHLPYRGR